MTFLATCIEKIVIFVPLLHHEKFKKSCINTLPIAASVAGGEAFVFCRHFLFMKKSNFIMIPDFILCNENLCPNSMILYGRIMSLCKQGGVCFASNKYFKEEHNFAPSTTARLIRELSKEGLVKSWVVMSNNYPSRRIKIINPKPPLSPIKKNKKIPLKVKSGSPKENYKNFLNSQYWKDVRELILMRDNYICTCGSNKRLQVHHKTYKNHRKEHENLQDLITLCKLCHDKQHTTKHF